jgi:hypothetical protein
MIRTITHIVVYTVALSALALTFAILFSASADAATLGKPDHVYRFNPNAGHGKIADSDGRVPEYEVCGFRALGRYSFRTNAEGEVEGVIRLNVCAHKRLDHRVREWRKTIEHERMHALGYKLGE